MSQLRLVASNPNAKSTGSRAMLRIIPNHLPPASEREESRVRVNALMTELKQLAHEARQEKNEQIIRRIKRK